MSDFNSIKKIIGEDNFNKYIDDIMSRVYIRIAGSLTDSDMNEIKLLDQKDSSGDLAEYFLLSRIPNFYEILKEESKNYVNSILPK